MIHFDIPNTPTPTPKKTPTLGDYATKFWFSIMGTYFLFHLCFKVTPPQNLSNNPAVANIEQKPMIAKAEMPRLFDLFKSESEVSNTAWAANLINSTDRLAAERNSVELSASKRFVERFAKVALREQEKFGIPASILLARGILISKQGTAAHLLKTNNYFGAGCTVGEDCTQHFDSAWLSLRAQSTQLKNTLNNTNLKPSDYRGWAQQVANAHHDISATELVAVIEVLNLHFLGRA